MSQNITQSNPQNIAGSAPVQSKDIPPPKAGEYPAMLNCSENGYICQPVSQEDALQPEADPIALFRISPLIRLTLLLFYVALTLPLPFLAKVTDAPIAPSGLCIGLFSGGFVLYAALTEQVIVTSTGIVVTHPVWLRLLWRRGWSLSWSEVASLKPRSTGQGGIVYYVLSHSGQAYLLPMRIARFARFVTLVQEKTDIDMTDVKPLAQPWMYFILLGFTLLLLLMDCWTLWTAATSIP